jgi:anti-sigma factor RsiW
MPEPNVEQLGACPDLSLIAAYVDGRLTDSERESLHRHLALCDLCTELVTEVVAANAMAMDVAPVAAPPFFPFFGGIARR